VTLTQKSGQDSPRFHSTGNVEEPLATSYSLELQRLAKAVCFQFPVWASKTPLPPPGKKPNVSGVTVLLVDITH
jgi:hypothetical protein